MPGKENLHICQFSRKHKFISWKKLVNIFAITNAINYCLLLCKNSMNNSIKENWQNALNAPEFQVQWIFLLNFYGRKSFLIFTFSSLCQMLWIYSVTNWNWFLKVWFALNLVIQLLNHYAKIGNTENWPHIQMSLLFTLEIRVSESFQLMDNCFSDFDGSGVVVEF